MPQLTAESSLAKRVAVVARRWWHWLQVITLARQLSTPWAGGAVALGGSKPMALDFLAAF